jgi:molecular chaperone DnaK (HSP70)
MEMKILPINELRTLLAAVSAHGERHLAEVDADLQQTAFLLDEAISKLGVSFMAVHELISQQQEVLSEIAKNGEIKPQSLAALNQFKEEIGNEVNSMVTGLQFQDMTNQLLHRTIKRVNGLKELLQELEIHGHEMDANREHQDIAAFLSSLNESLDAGSHALSGNLRKSVGQRDMVSGDIDLF